MKMIQIRANDENKHIIIWCMPYSKYKVILDILLKQGYGYFTLITSDTKVYGGVKYLQKYKLFNDIKGAYIIED